MSRESWRRCHGRFGDFYVVSDAGRVKRFRTQHGNPCARIIKPLIKHGYEQVCLSVHNKKYYRPVHRLVAKAFLGPPPSSIHQVNHIDGDKRNNRVGNLEWCTPRENRVHALRLGLATNGTPPVHYGESHPQNRLAEDEVREIRWLARRGGSSRRIGRLYGVSKTTVRDIMKGKNWGHVQGEKRPFHVALADVARARGRKVA